jgi:hypothetical protein
MEICIEYRPRLQIANIAVFTANQEEDFVRTLKNVRCEPDTLRSTQAGLVKKLPLLSRVYGIRRLAVLYGSRKAKIVLNFSPVCVQHLTLKPIFGDTLYVRFRTVRQCCGSMTFWGGSGSGSADPCILLMDPDPSIFIIDLQDACKKLPRYFFNTIFSAYDFLKLHLHHF